MDLSRTSIRLVDPSNWSIPWDSVALAAGN